MADLDDEILQMYIEESREHLANIEQDLLSIEENGADINEELVNKVFRAAHSLKGGAGFFNLLKIKELAHKIENVLDMVRSKELVPDADIINILLVSFDKLRELINNHTESNEADISDVIVSLNGMTSVHLPKDQKESITKSVDISLPDGTKVLEVSEFDITNARKKGNSVYLVEYDLIHDIHRIGKQPLGIINAMLDRGTILDCAVDLAAVGTLDDELSNRIPFYVLYATLVKPADISILFDVSDNKIQLIASGDSPRTEETSPPAEESMPLCEKHNASCDIPVPLEKLTAPASTQTIPLSSAETVEEPAEIKQDTTKTQGGPSPVQSETSLRVNVNLLETLMNLAGELVLSRNQLLEAIGQNDLRVIKASGQRINLVTSELQEAIMLTRMQPIGNVMNKFPRVVRDLAKNLMKEVRLNLSGKEVEMDKTIVEALSDPLTHLVRNAVDHGIELPDIRIKAGKNPVGTINLKAYHEAGQVNIEISDDGKGIDPRRIGETAVAKGLVPVEQLKIMSDKEIMSLILLPGFSTAENVTDLSGRGVGMDVVKTNLDRLGGQVDIESTLGKGSTFRIKLPLTLAIIPCLLVSVNNERFAIPQVNVDELTRIPASQVKNRIEQVGDAEVLMLRGKLIPIIHLADILNIPRTYIDPKDGQIKPDRRKRIVDRRSEPKPNNPVETVPHSNDNGTNNQVMAQRDGRDSQDRRYHSVSDLNIVVVTAGSLQYGLVLQELHDTVEIVVKPLGLHLKHLRAYAGSTIMGDGRVALILDVAGLAEMAGLKSLSSSAETDEMNDRSRRALERENQSFLLFRNAPDEQCAVPLEIVDRVEQIQPEEIEIVGGKRILQYRGEIMSLFSLQDVADVKPLPDKETYIVIVFNMAGKNIGLLATTPVDVIETKVAVDLSTLKQRAIMGSAIINSITTQIVDIVECVKILHPDWTFGQQTIRSPSNRGFTILLAEDSEFFRAQVKQLIEDDGYKVVAAEDGLVAWNILQDYDDNIGLVVTDLEMPNLDGYGLTKNIKGDDRFSHLPVIALSSLASDEDVARGKAAGVDDYQIKLDREKLLESINSLLDTIDGRGMKKMIEGGITHVIS